MKITLLATSDTHGFIEPTNYVDSKMDKPYGLEKIKSAVDDYVNHHPDERVVLIDNGDFLEGSPLAYYVAKLADNDDRQTFIHAYNEVGYQIGSIGNHEFDYGLDYLKDVMARSRRKFVCANVVDKDGQPSLADPYTVLNVGGIKIGFLGLTTTSTKKWKNVSNIPDFNLISEVEAAKRYIPEMKKQCDFVVIVYHGGFERDKNGNWIDINPGENKGYDILHQLKGIDALITGHQHRKIASKLFGTPIVQPGYRGELVARITFDVNAKKKAISRSETELISVGAFPSDQEMRKDVHGLRNNLKHWLDKPLSRIKGSLTFSDPFEARIEENPFIEFIQKVQMDKMGVDISATALYNNEAHGFESPITMRNIITNYVYPNTLVVSEISGADLKAALEVSAQYFEIAHGKVVVNKRFMFPKQRSYNYDMYEGIDYTLKISNPVGKRVVSLKYHGKDVSDDQKLRVVLNRYRANGGGHYPMFTADKIVKSSDEIISQVILDYLLKNPIIDATANKNFHVIV